MINWSNSHVPSVPTQSVNMADMDAETTAHTEPTADGDEPLFSNLDLFLFSLIVGLVIYWFMSRKKPEPIPEFKKLDTLWVPVMAYLGFSITGFLFTSTSDFIFRRKLKCRALILVVKKSHIVLDSV